MELTEFRTQYPQYDDIPDMDLAKGLHEKHYADIPFEEFSKQLGLVQAKEGSVLKSGLAKGMAAYGDVATMMQNVAPTIMKSPLFAPARLLAPEVTEEQQVGLKQEQVDRATFWNDMNAQHEPDFNPQEPVRSTVRRAASGAVGLLAETPLFLAGGGPAGSVAKTVAAKAITRYGTTKGVETAVNIAARGTTMAGSFAGEAALRAKSPEEIRNAGLTGFAVGAAGLVPKPFKTVSEAAALVAAGSLLDGTEVTPQSFGEVLAMLVELKLLHKVMGKTSGGVSDFGKAISVAQERGKINERQAEAIKMAASDPAVVSKLEVVGREAERYAEQEIPSAATKANIKGGEVARAEEAKRIIDERLAQPEPVIELTEPSIVAEQARVAIERVRAAEPTRAEVPAAADPTRLERVNTTIEALERRQASLPVESREAVTRDLDSFYVERRQLEGARESTSSEGITPALGARPFAETTAALSAPAAPAPKGSKLSPEEVIARAKETVGPAEFIKTVTQEIAQGKAPLKGTEAHAQVIERVARSIVEGPPAPKGPAAAEQLVLANIKAAALKKQQGSFDPKVFLPESLQMGADKMGAGLRTVLEGAKVMREYRGNKEGLQKEFAEIDRFNKFHAGALTILQIADMNPNIPGFTKAIQEGRLTYIDGIKLWSNERRTMMAEPDARLKAWQKLGKEQSDRLGRILLEETELGREFTQKELDSYRLNDKAKQARLEIKEDFRNFLNELEKIEKERATRQLEGEALTNELRKISDDLAGLRSKPYFPMTRYGEHGVKLVNELGGVEVFKLYESKTLPGLAGESQALGAIKLASEYKNELMNKGWKLTKVYVSPDVQGLAGLPANIAKRLAERLQLDGEQMANLAALAYEAAPTRSFRKHLLERNMTPGWSEDAQRGYASYFFHGSNHLARLRYGEQLFDAVGDVKASAKALDVAGISPASRQLLVRHLEGHYDYIMSPKEEFAALRSAGFVFYMGFLPKAAFMNLTQVPMVTLPHLAAKYGDVAAGAALVKASKDVSLFMKGSKVIPEEIRLMDRLRLEGVTNDSYAAALAGVSEGRFMSRTLPRTKVGSVVSDIGGRASYLFTMTEGFNRRVTALSAYRLARKKGIPEEQSYTAAREAVEKTQYEYANWNRPKFMQGKKSVVFLFMQYLQNTLYFMARDPGNKRAIGMLLAAAGIQGLPGMDHILDGVDKMFSTRNKKFSSREELRLFLNEYDMNPDLIMHGAGRYGLGLPWMAQQVGIPMPDVDLSGSMSMGDIVPGLRPIMKGGDFERQFSETTRGAAGAAIAIPIGIWQALASDDPNTYKRIEKAMPNVVKAGMRAYDLSRTGEVKTRSGEVIHTIDKDSPQGIVEIGTTAAGFANTQANQQYEQTFARKDTAEFYMARRKELLAGINAAMESGDKIALKEAKEDMVLYNKEVPFRALGITGDDIRNSIKGRARSTALAEKHIDSVRQLEITKKSQEAYPVK